MTNYFEDAYIELVNEVIVCGEERTTRDGPTRQLFGRSIEIPDLRFGYFPVLTQRKMFPRPVLGELAAFLRGATRLQSFKDFGCNYWDANAAAWSYNQGVPSQDHTVGQIYGAQWRNWRGQGHDQVRKLILGLLEDPHSRRHLLTTYDPEETHACLPPCHLLAQFSVTNDRHLECCVYMRSVDLCLGLPSDVILYAALLVLIAAEVDMQPGKLVFMLGDTHVYENHVNIWKLLQERNPATRLPAPPEYQLHHYGDLLAFQPDDIQLINYVHGEKVDYPFNV